MIRSRVVTTGVVCAAVLAGGLLHGLGSGSAQDRDAQSVPPSDPVAVDADDGIGAAVNPVNEKRGARRLDPTGRPVVGTTMKTDAGRATTFVHYEYWTADTLPSEKWMQELLDKPVPVLDFPRGTPVKEIFDFLLQHLNKSFADEEFRWDIQTDPRLQEEWEVESLADIPVGVEVQLQGVSLRSALKLILGETREPRLGYEIRDGVMFITPCGYVETPNIPTTRVYPAGHLLAVHTPPVRRRQRAIPEQTGAGQGFFSTSDELDPSEEDQNGASQEKAVEFNDRLSPADRLIDLIMELSSPSVVWQQRHGGGGDISVFRENLVILQTAKGHRAVVDLLNLLSRSVASP